MPTDPVRRRVLELARASRGNPDPEVIAEKRAALAEAKLAEYIKRVVAEAPPLSASQRDRLALLLREAS